MEWNVVVTVDEDFDAAEEELAALGSVARTEYFNVLVMKVEDPDAFLRDLEDRGRMVPPLLRRWLSRVEPARHTIQFQSGDEFEERASEVIRGLAPELAGKSFHVRMHRRGFREDLDSGEEERKLAGVVYETLREEDLEEPSVTFDDPDAVLVVETVSNRAGISLWTREDLEEHPILRPE
ncbi:MAG: THUMP domain-containing protein [Gemmatimonadota bacterium]